LRLTPTRSSLGIALKAFLLPAAICLVVLSPSGTIDATAKIQWIQFKDGHLFYGTDQFGNRIPDFSTAGYEGGGAIIPRIPVRSTLDPLPDGDDTPRIQQAIDALASQPLDENGFRGALLLHAGTYRIGGTINLNGSGIVLRGAGNGTDGTILAAQGLPRTLIRVGGVGSWQPAGPRHRIMDKYVPIGVNTITVDDDHDLKIGDRVVVDWAMDAPFIHLIGMDRIPERKDGQTVRQWEPGMGLKFDRTIVAVEHTSEGERITLDASLTNGMYRAQGPTVWRYTFSERVSHVGIEDLRTDGTAFEKTADVANTETRFDALFASYDSVENAWMRDLVLTHFSRIVNIEQYARAVSIERIQGTDINFPEDRAVPHAFGIDGQQSLIEDCHISGSYSHVWMTQSRVAGPNVFRSCSAKGTHLDAGPHERWATGTLYDELRIEGSIGIQNRSNLGTGHGWAGANNVLWNCEASSYVIEMPPVAYNWAFGTKGSLENLQTQRREIRRGQQSGNAWGQIISPGKHVLPESLYEEQLKERLH
jgi:hypothetical protein